jgi:UDP-N-acetylmuramoyl-tripeptide--D-alanyl-D-alanine ligase
MIRERLATAATWMGGVLDGADAPFAGVATDSRKAADEALFVALRGEHHDGHDHLGQAAREGAVAAVVDHRIDAAPLAQIVVADTRLALGDLARHWRQRLPARVVALTGSNGKTTVKTLLASILGGVGRTAATRGNLNNEIGLPLTVLSLDREVDYAVLEMGCGQPGDIEYLARIGQPHVALVNNAGPAHLERLGSVEGVAHAKAEIYAGLGADGTGVVNADDAFAPYFSQVLGARQQLRFGLTQPAAITARDLQLGASSRFVLVAPAGEVAVDLPLPGRHNVMNALAAATCAIALGAGLDAIGAGLQSAHGVSGRLTRHVATGGWTLFDDSYNANPASVMAGIATLVLGGGEAWLALGDMKELGPHESRLHAEVGQFARAQGVTRMFTVGPLSASAAEAFGAGARSFADRDALAQALAGELHAGVRVLVKGSRSSGMERVVDRVLAAHAMQPGESDHAA